MVDEYNWFEDSDNPDAVKVIQDVFYDRAGFDHWMDCIDVDMQKEILENLQGWLKHFLLTDRKE